MPTPRLPSGLKPLVRGYGYDAPDGVHMTQVAGGMPRPALRWWRGKQLFSVSLLNNRTRQSVWTAFFHHVIRNGSVQFIMPIDSGNGLEDHVCMIQSGSMNTVPAGSGLHWEVSFVVKAESTIYDAMTYEDAVALIALYEEEGDDMGLLLERIEQFTSVDMQVLEP